MVNVLIYKLFVVLVLLLHNSWPCQLLSIVFMALC